MNIRALGIAAFALAALAVECGVERGAAEEVEPGMKVETIPLKKVYTYNTATEKDEDQSVRDLIADKAIRLALDDFLSISPGTFDAFLVRGKDIKAAILATTEVLRKGRSADTVGSAEDKESKRVWAVAFLGFHASRPTTDLVVRSVQKRGTNIQVSLVPVVNKGGASEDSTPYLVWVPLNEVKAGTYTVSIFNEDNKAVSVARRVVVSAK